MIKLVVYLSPFVVLSIVYYNLYLQAERARVQAETARNAANRALAQVLAERTRNFAAQKQTLRALRYALAGYIKYPDGEPRLDAALAYAMQALDAETPSRIDSEGRVVDVTFLTNGILGSHCCRGRVLDILDRGNS